MDWVKKGQNDGYNLSKRGKVQVAKHEWRRQNFTSYQLKTEWKTERERQEGKGKREKSHITLWELTSYLETKINLPVESHCFMVKTWLKWGFWLGIRQVAQALQTHFFAFRGIFSSVSTKTCYAVWAPCIYQCLRLQKKHHLLVVHCTEMQTFCSGDKEV